MYTINIPNYQNRFVSEPQFSDYKQLLFRAGDILQGSEVNEIQNTLQNDFAHMSSRFITNGDFINGGLVSISKEGTGVNDGNGYEFHNFEIICAEGVFFFDGHLFTVPERKINYTDVLIQDADFELGVEIEYEIVSFREDSSLLEPANNIRNFGQPGADRLSVKGVWELGPEQEDQTLVNITSIIDGVVIGETVVNEFDKEVIEIVAEYDRESRGNYLIDGHLVKFLEKPSYLGDFSFQIGEGKADIYGYKYKRNFTSEFILPELVDFELHQSEPTVFHDDGQYDLNHDPVRKVFRISGEKNITQPMDHGSYSGATDTFPSAYTPVVRIKNVSQGATQYVAGRDYFQDGDSINWLTQEPGAIEPAPNSSYTIEWDYRETQTYGNFIGDNGKINNEKTGITLLGYVSGSVVSIDYDFVLQRKDVILIGTSGSFRYIKGVAREYDPLTPRFNEENNLAIAEVLLSADNDPQIKQTGQRVFKMEDIEKLYGDIRTNGYEIGRMALKLDLKSFGTNLKNTFIDSFMDDAWRDAGIETGTNYIRAISANGKLTQNINWETVSTQVTDLEYLNTIPQNPKTARLRTVGSPVSIISQLESTGDIQVTSLFFATSQKARLRVIPSYYSWVDRSIYSDFDVSERVTTRLVEGDMTIKRSWTERVEEWVVSSTSSATITNSDKAAIIPKIPLRLISEEGDYNANEQVEINWGGKLIHTVSSDSNGKLDHTFDLPDHQMSGAKLIEANGLVSGVEGVANFFAQPLTKTVIKTITKQWRTIKFIPRRKKVDPVAQSFSSETSFILDSVKVWFNFAPTSDSFIEIVELTAGYPDNSRKLTSRQYRVGDITDNSSFTYDLLDKITIEGGKSYAFIIGCEDPVATIQLATMGEKSISGKWITSQAYNEGVMFNSSNNETWTPLQTKDLKFELFSTSFETEKVFEFEPIQVVDATDLIILSMSENGIGNNINYDLEFLDGGLSTMKNIRMFEQIPIGSEYTGEIQLIANMTSDGSSSPEMTTDAQIVVGKIDLSSTYTSKGFEFDPDDKSVVMYINRISSGTAAYTAEIQILQGGAWNWVPIPLVELELLGRDKNEEYEEYEDRFEIDLQAQSPDVEQTITRVRLNLESSDVTDRIILRSLRLNTLNL